WSKPILRPPIARELFLRRRQEYDLVLGGERNHVGRVLLLHAVDRPEQIVQLARRRDPEQALDRLLRLIEQAVRDVHRQGGQGPPPRRGFRPPAHPTPAAL